MPRRPWKNTLRWLALLTAGLSTGSLTIAFLRGVPLLERGSAESGVPALRVDDRMLEPLRQVEAQLLRESDTGIGAPEQAVAAELVLLNRAYAGYMARGRSGVGESEIPARVAIVQKAAANSIALGPAIDPMRPLMRLRAQQFARFMAEFARSRAVGRDREAMLDVGAQFLLRMREIGYVHGYKTDLSSDEIATLYKLAWNNSASLDADLGWGFAQKPASALYKLTQAHRGLMLALAMRAPVTKLPSTAKPEDLRRTRVDVLNSKIQEAGKYDPNYPVDYAMGIAHTLANRPDEAHARFEAANAAGLGPELRTSGYLLRPGAGRVD